MRRLGSAVLGLLLMSTLAALPPTRADAESSRASAQSSNEGSASAAPGCADRARAVPHRAGGVRVAAGSVKPGPRPCLFRTGVPSWEPTIGLTRRGWIFEGGDGARYVRAGSVGVGGLFATVARSKDGGRTWQDVSPPQLPTPLGDPFLHLDPVTERIFIAQYNPNACYQLSFSDDGGDTWTTNPQVCGLADHENIFTAPPTTSVTVGYPRVVYICAGHLGVGTTAQSSLCLKSLDGGLSFVPTGAPPYPPTPEGGGGGVAQGLGGPDGTLYLPTGWHGYPYLAISRNEGATWERHRVADSLFPIDPNVASVGTPYAHQAGVALDARGNLYYTWVDEHRRPMLAISRDGGERWSKPMAVGPPGLYAASLPAVDAGRTGAVAIAYMGTVKNGPGWNGYITASANALSPRPLFYTATVNHPRDPLVVHSCGVIRCENAGDFFDIAIGPDGSAYASFVDACSPRCLATRDHDLAEGVVGRLAGLRLR